jgi:hypothetical protein
MRKGWRRMLVAGAAAGLAVAATVPAASASSEPLRYAFTKTCTLGAISVCSGSAAGDVSGGLTAVEQPGTRWSDGIGHVTFVETVAGETMLVTGIFNTHNFLIVMNGRVTEGPNAGARTHHSAKIVGFEAGPDGPLAVIEGTGFILPRSAG